MSDFFILLSLLINKINSVEESTWSCITTEPSAVNKECLLCKLEQNYSYSPITSRIEYRPEALSLHHWAERTAPRANTLRLDAL